MNRHRLAPLLAALTVLTVACGRQNQLSKPQQLPHGSAAQHVSLSCDQSRDADTLYRHYRGAVRGLVRGDSPPQIQGLSCFLGEQAVRQLNAQQAYGRLINEVFDADILYAALRAEFQEVLTQDDRLGLRRDAGLAWPGAYLSEAALVAFRQTGQERFLDLFVDYFDAVLLRRDDRLGRVDGFHQRIMKAWGSVNIGKTLWVAHVTHNARIVYPATEFVRLVRQDARLRRFLPKADVYLAASRETLDAFEGDLVAVPSLPGLRWYRRPLENSYEAINHLHVVGTAWLNLAHLTGEDRYKRHVEELISVFRLSVRPEPGGLVSWNYFPVFASDEKRRFPNGQEYSEPVWKVVLTTPFLLRAYRQGYAMPLGLVTSIARTLDELTIQGDQLWRNLARRQSRPVDPNRDRSKLGMVKNTVALVEYASLRPSLLPKMAALVAARPDLFPAGWLSSPPGLLAYAYYLQPSTSGLKAPAAAPSAANDAGRSSSSSSSSSGRLSSP